MFKKYFLTIFVFFGVLGVFNTTQAGFGISPPYVKTNKPIFAGSHYEQRITLLRSSADDDLVATITVNAPEIEPWISLDKGDVFDLPKGKYQVPMIVKVDIPPDAEIGNYKGHINVRISPKDKSRGAGVAIALGARIDIDLEVTDETFVDFIIRKVDIPDFEEFTKPWNWPIFSYFFYKMNLVIDLENSGNIKIAPTKVHVDVYDLSEKELLGSYDDKSIEKIDPFIQGKTTASFRTKLPAGQYWAKIKIYKDKDIVHKDKIIFTIREAGSTSGGLKMGFGPWAMLSAMVLASLVVIALSIKLRSWRILLILIWPLLFILKKLLSFLGFLKKKFWRWIYKKSAQHQRNERK
jgi:hypothetical protein